MQYDVIIVNAHLGIYNTRSGPHSRHKPIPIIQHIDLHTKRTNNLTFFWCHIRVRGWRVLGVCTYGYILYCNIIIIIMLLFYFVVRCSRAHDDPRADPADRGRDLSPPPSPRTSRPSVYGPATGG